ncbi:MAG: hypothetical protein PHV34_05960 [Verrucomicrobiae bacterium]|nr:hypothetical protein [Verrucomicrobiae bacterium]
MTQTPVIPEQYLRHMSDEDRRAFGKAGRTMEEINNENEVKNEKNLQNQIAGLLRLRGIAFSWCRMDKKTERTG